MKFGINTLLWTASFDRSHIDLLTRIKEAGFDGVEIARFAFDDFPVADVRRALEQNGLECIMCSALTGRTSLADPDTHTAALDFLKRGIRTAADLGAKLLVGPFCSPVGYLTGRRRTQDEWRRVIDGLRELTPVLEDAGVTMAI
jgi:D-psicose/D-tagatose/L-ribulose 3-epimerase